MSMNDLHRAFRLIDEHSDEADFVGTRSEELVELAASALGLTFPPTYREFLLRLGAGDIAGAEFYGVITADFVNSGVPDAIWLAMRHRNTSQLPKSLVMVYTYGEGTYCAIDTSQRIANGESPIVIWDPGLSLPDDKLEVVAEDFGRFFYKTIEYMLRDC